MTARQPPGVAQQDFAILSSKSGLTLDGSKGSWFSVVFGNSRVFPVTVI
jgi:hypothetical protein